MKLDSPDAIAQAKSVLLSKRHKPKRVYLDYKEPVKRDPQPRFANTPEDEAKALRKLVKLLGTANGEKKYVKRHKEVKRGLLTKLKSIL